MEYQFIETGNILANVCDYQLLSQTIGSAEVESQQISCGFNEMGSNGEVELGAQVVFDALLQYSEL